MNLQPSTSTMFNERRQVFAGELQFGGHGQVYLSGAGTFYPSSTDYVFYQIQFLTDSTVSSVGFRNYNEFGSTVYSADEASFSNVAFPAGLTWSAPLTSITLGSGSGIAYEYKKYSIYDLCDTCRPFRPDGGYMSNDDGYYYVTPDGTQYYAQPITTPVTTTPSPTTTLPPI